MVLPKYKLRTHALLSIFFAYGLLAIALMYNQAAGGWMWGAWFFSCALLLCWQYLAHGRLQREIQAINLHADSLRDNAFNLSANTYLLNELLPTAHALSEMSNHLQRERANLYQRELLLDTVLQTSPSALVLTDENARVLLSNPAARSLLNKGKRFEGDLFTSLLDQLPELNTALAQQQSLVFFDESASIWHLSTSRFQLNQRNHFLYQFKPITKEIHQEEIKAWRKLLRVIGHELNNSLAPMSSLAYSGRVQAEAKKLDSFAGIFSTISERCQHLNHFLQDYINFAKLPVPQMQTVNWVQLVNELQDHYDFELIGDLPQREWSLDQTQLAQLLLNLLKNAKEAGATAMGIQLGLQEHADCLVIELHDDGCGMSEEVIDHALVPFYTTKEQGSGIGLTLCQDIVQGHGGRLELISQDIGLLVRVFLPYISQQVDI